MYNLPLPKLCATLLDAPLLLAANNLMRAVLYGGLNSFLCRHYLERYFVTVQAIEATHLLWVRGFEQV